MPKRHRLLLVVGLVIVLVAAGLVLWRLKKHQGAPLSQNTPVYAGFQLSSPAFKDNATIPVKYTCKGENINPPLQIVGPPATAKSFALILHDPDALKGDFTHWTIWNLDRSTESIDEGRPPDTATQGANGTDKSGYIGPCPPTGTGTHHYIFELYALDGSLDLPTGTSVKQLRETIKDHKVGQTKLTGLFAADP